MDTTELSTRDAGAATDEELRAWDWRAELERQERSIPWLARHTQRSESAVRQYASGVLSAPVKWLRMAAVTLNWRP